MLTCIKDCIASKDPLSDEIITYLVGYHEETELIDFKVTAENDDKAWLEVTKDVLAFSNTHGGYLVYGIQNASFEVIGLAAEALVLVRDADNFMKKINKHIEPPVSLIRCKHFKISTKDLTAIFIPPSHDKTHLVSKDGVFTHISEKQQTVLRKGTTYVRQSAGNHIMDSRDMDDIVNRRIDFFKHSLLEKITKVVEAPKDSEIFVLSEDKSNSEHKRFVIQDSPDAIPVKGMSFTTPPKTTEHEIAAWVAMTTRDPKALPNAAITWKWYVERKSLSLSAEQCLSVAKYSLLTSAPAFYWLRGCDATSIIKMLNEALNYDETIDSIGDIISTGAFLGLKYHQSLIIKIGKLSSRLNRASLTIPHDGPKVFFRAANIKLKKEELENELNSIAESSKEKESEPILKDRLRAQTLDCTLYAQDNKYIN